MVFLKTNRETIHFFSGICMEPNPHFVWIFQSSTGEKSERCALNIVPNYIKDNLQGFSDGTKKTEKSWAW